MRSSLPAQDGGRLHGAGFDGALDRYRPPGTFSFITGPAQLYPLFTACWFALLLARQLPIWTMVASGASILVTLPVSVDASANPDEVIAVLKTVSASLDGDPAFEEVAPPDEFVN